MNPGPKPIDPQIRFWRKVQKGGDDECWLWTAGTQGKGYGQFYVAKRQPVGAHRYSWSLVNGPVPAGRFVMHTCDNPPCVNPGHLRVGTAKDNNVDTTTKGRNPGNRTSDRSYVKRKVDDRAVKALRSAGLTMKEIGDMLGVAPSTVLRSLRR